MAAQSISAPRPGAAHAVAAGFMGWTLDAFDFFVVVFLYDALAAQFHVSKGAIIATVGYTLAMRPVGALLFGLLADRYGRRLPLIANVIFFSAMEVACGFAPNYTTFAVLRTLFGIGMGGEWGVGSSLAMESAPPRWRGILSGVVQSGYSCGYLLAAVASRLILPHWSWRAMFWAGGLPALLAFYIRMKVPESEAWKQHRAPNVRGILSTIAGPRTAALVLGFALLGLAITLALMSLARTLGLGAFLLIFVLFFAGFISVAAASRPLAYLIMLMTLMTFLSHGTQDLYPDFLKTAHRVSQALASDIAIIYNVGAILGAIVFGQLSEIIGRRRSMLLALALALAVIPLWAFGGSLPALIFGAFVMQVGVQGAWGIIPAHLNELAPDAARSLIPGLAYQLGILFASPTNTLEHHLHAHVGYQWALGGFEIVNIILLGTVIALGKEQKGRSFMSS